jgi:hypothetical protein
MRIQQSHVIRPQAPKQKIPFRHKEDSYTDEEPCISPLCVRSKRWRGLQPCFRNPLKIRQAFGNPMFVL